MTRLRNLIALIAIAISTISMPSIANPPESGSFKIPQVVIKDKGMFEFIEHAIKKFKKKNCDPRKYDVYISLSEHEKYISMYIEIEATSNVPWYKWDSFAVIDGYTCFFDAKFSSLFAKKINNKQRVFKYSFVSSRENKNPVYILYCWIVYDKNGNFEVFNRPLIAHKKSRSQDKMQKIEVDIAIKRLNEYTNMLNEEPLGPYYPDPREYE